MIRSGVRICLININETLVFDEEIRGETRALIREGVFIYSCSARLISFLTFKIIYKSLLEIFHTLLDS